MVNSTQAFQRRGAEMLRKAENIHGMFHINVQQKIPTSSIIPSRSVHLISLWTTNIRDSCCTSANSISGGSCDLATSGMGLKQGKI